MSVLHVLIPASVRALSQEFYTAKQIESAITYVFGPDTLLIADETYFVAEIGGIVVGCGGWSQRRTLYGGDQSKAGADPLLDPTSDPARLRAFFVHPDWARRGVASRLLTACRDAARQAGFVRLELMATLPGEPLYRAFGFAVIQHVQTVLPDGVIISFVRMEGALDEAS